MAGSVRERSPGVHEMRYRGKSKTFHGSKRAADRALSAFVTSLAPRAKPAKGTVGELLERFMERAELSPTTRREYRRIIDKRLAPTFGAMPVDQLTTGQLSAYYDRLRDDLAPASVRHVHTVMRSAYKMALGDDEVQTNPAAGARLPARRRPSISVPTTAEVQQLVAAAEPRLSRAIRVLAGTGVRRGELLGLQWDDLANGVLFVRRSVAVVARNELTVKGTKTHQTRRVPVGPKVVAALEDFSHREGFIFSDHADGVTPWNPDWLTGTFRRLCESVGVKTTLHGLRHYHVTLLLQRGMSFPEVADRVGHEDPRMTLVVYREAVPDRTRQAAELAEDFF